MREYKKGFSSEKHRSTCLKNFSNQDGKVQSRRLKKRLTTEKSLSDALCLAGYDVMCPSVACDRIAVKDGKVYFVEFKKQGQSLREGQKKIQALLPDNYLIIYYK